MKLKGTYLEIVFDKDDRMRCTYNPRGTKFGRISSSKTIFETGMNMQNLPEEFAGFRVSDTGKIIVSLDKAKAEWVVVAYESGDASMINAIESGIDVHAYTASQMFKIPLDVITFEEKIIGHSNDAEDIARKRKNIRELDPYIKGWLPRTTSIRQCGKKSNHGLNYDERKAMFALTNEITEKEAAVIINFYHSIYPGIKRWYNRIQSKLGENRILTNCFGRKCRFLNRWGDYLFKAAYSFLPQSTVGEIVNRGMVEIYNSTDEAFDGWEILRQVHDSIDFQCDDGSAGAIARGIIQASRCLTPELSAGGRTYTIATDCKIGYSLDTMIDIPITNENEMTKARNPQLIDDKADCFRIFADSSTTRGGAIAYAEHILSQAGPIQLMTGHKSKGLEFNNVIFLDEFLVGEEDQDPNLRYVIITRAKEKLVYAESKNFVDGGEYESDTNNNR